MNRISDFLPPQGETRVSNCDKHGEFQSALIIGRIWSSCPHCVKESFEAEQVRLDEEQRSERVKSWERRMGQAGIPERFQDRTLQAYIAQTDRQQQILAACASYANQFSEKRKTGACLMMCGKPGTGKTHLACAIGLHVMEHHRATVLFTTAMRMMRKVKDTYNRDSEKTESQAIAELAFPDLLILDEVGVQFGSDTEKNIFFDVLNERYEKRRPTIFLSNLPRDDFDRDGKRIAGLRSYLGERIYDRLLEGGLQYLPFNWESYRGKA